MTEHVDYFGWVNLSADSTPDTDDECRRRVRVQATRAPVVLAYELAVAIERTFDTNVTLSIWPCAGMHGFEAQVAFLIEGLSGDSLGDDETPEGYLAWIRGYLAGRAHEDER